MGENLGEFFEYFPFETPRKPQIDFVSAVGQQLRKLSNLIVHAPTGIGKTAAALAPTLKYAVDNKKTVLFLTSRHTQHDIAIETLKRIRDEHGVEANVVDIIGKKWMCCQDNVDKLYSNEFSEYCKSVRESGSCDYYEMTKKNNKLTVEAKKTIGEVKGGIYSTKEITDICKRSGVCAYEIAMSLASKAHVVIADYYYVFNPNVADSFFAKTGKKIEDCIIVVDEAHNLPARLMEVATSRLSSVMIERAYKEADKFRYEESAELIQMLGKILDKLAKGMKTYEERLVEKNTFQGLISHEIDYMQLQNDLEYIAEEIREKQRMSYVGGIAHFLSEWLAHPTKGFARILKVERGRRGQLVTLSNYCLDPSVIAKKVIDEAHSTILMSGTLTPTSMYKEVIGFDHALEKEYESPFPEQNRLNMIVPKTTTKYAARSDAQYKAIAEECAKIVNNVPGNSILFFPSYMLRDSVAMHFNSLCKKKIYNEVPSMTLEDKNKVLERFKEGHSTGGVLMGVVSGNFYEGVDLPGDLLKCVVIIGLPLQQPDLRTKELIAYYDKKYNKGWDYGYVYPAFNKALQSAGRCIRSENDKGVIVYLDERYIWPNYRRCFPKGIEFTISREPEKDVKDFFQ